MSDTRPSSSSSSPESSSRASTLGKALEASTGGEEASSGDAVCFAFGGFEVGFFWKKLEMEACFLAWDDAKGELLGAIVVVWRQVDWTL